MDKEKEIERLIDSYGNDVLRIAYMYLKDNSLAQDVFQDVFIKVYKNFHNFQGKSSEKTWIMSITMNTCKDLLRSSWFKRILSMDSETAPELASTSENVDNQVIKQIEHESLTKEVMNLPQKYKEPLLLYYYENFSTTEIAKILKIPEGTVRTRLHRGREILKINIDGKIEYEG